MDVKAGSSERSGELSRDQTDRFWVWPAGVWAAGVWIAGVWAGNPVIEAPGRPGSDGGEEWRRPGEEGEQEVLQDQQHGRPQQVGHLSTVT